MRQQNSNLAGAGMGWAAPWVHLPVVVSLVVIAVLIDASVIASLIATRKS